MIGQAPTLTVSEFVAVFNQSLEMMYPQITIVGELSNFRVSKGKWVYFDLKDEFSSVKFFGAVYALPGPLEDGITCEVVGRPRLHNQFGFSVNYESVRAVGEGSIRKAQDLLFKKLESEGLFAADRKRSLPYPPEHIGLVTSGESAAIADFKKIISKRWPMLQVELIDTLVQGNQAPAAIVAAVQQFNTMSNPPEVLVVIRGGGSTDDLAAFSDESVVRAIAASRVPTMVAIGHESDTSLAELVADMSASTPSNAAELLVPDVAHERAVVRSIRDHVAHQLNQIIAAERMYIRNKTNELDRSLWTVMDRALQDIQNTKNLLKALDPLAPLRQGYVRVSDDEGHKIKTADDFVNSKSTVFDLQFIDGKKRVRAERDE